MRAVLPHIQQALRLHHRLVAAESGAANAAAVLDQLADAVFMISHTGVVVAANRAAREILAGRDGLFLHKGELRASCASDDVALRAAIGAAIAIASGESSRAPRPVPVGRPSTRQPRLVTASPLPRSSYRALAPTAAVMVVVAEPERDTAVDEDTLKVLFELSKAEARLAMQLASGVRIVEAARRLGITEGTARTRLKAIFEKTGVHRQPELVRLLLTLAPRIG